MTISYANTPLSAGTAEEAAWIKRYADPSFIAEFAERTWPIQSMGGGGLRGHLPQAPVRIGVFSWPKHASRFATAYYLATDSQVAAIQGVIQSDTGQAFGTLELADGKRSVSTQMWMLPVRPIHQIAGAKGLNLVTLVDERFFWWFRSGNILVSEGTTTWAVLLAEIAGALGITLTVDTIPGAYLLPGGMSQSRYEPLPMLLDTVAALVGLVIVRGLDGSVYAMNARTASGLHTTNLAMVPRIGGGRIDLPALA